MATRTIHEAGIDFSGSHGIACNPRDLCDRCDVALIALHNFFPFCKAAITRRNPGITLPSPGLERDDLLVLVLALPASASAAHVLAATDPDW
jgi:hypothetical protein